MSAATHLAQYNISVEQARAYIVANLENLTAIYTQSISYNITADMLAEIYGGVSANDVVDFFNLNGLDGNALTGNDTPVTIKIKNELTIDDTDLGKIVFGATDYAGLSNSAASLLTGLDDFRVDARFSEIDGAGYAVVILDTAFDLDHSFFGPDADANGVADRIVHHADFTREGDGANASTLVNHGTHVASIVASSDSRYPGVAPGVNIITLQVLGEGATHAGFQKALQWVVENAAEYNVVAVNMSLSHGDNHATSQTDYMSDELLRLSELGIVTVSASGNDYEKFKTEGVGYPSSDPNSLSVGAGISTGIDSDTFGSFSQRSDTLTDIVAPGVGIEAGITGGGIDMWNGTSMASPYIAGVVALAQQLANSTLGRSLSVSEYINLMKLSAVVFLDSERASDEVPNTGDSFSRIDVHALAELILGMSEGNDAPAVPTLPDNDIVNNISTNAVIAVEGIQTGILEEFGDSDWYAITLVANSQYLFDLNGITLEDPYLRLYDTNGMSIASNDDIPTGSDGSVSPLDSQLSFTVATTGTYYLSAGSYQGSGKGTYTLSATVGTIQDDVPDTGNGSIGEYAGSIDFGGDRDSYSVSFERGTTYTITLSGVSSDAGRLIDPFVEVFDENFVLVKSDDDSGVGLGSALEYTATSSGGHYVVATGYDDSEGSYVLNITVTNNSSSGDSVLDNISTNASIADGQQVAGSIDFENDSDWYATTLSAGANYIISLIGSSTGAGGLADPWLNLYDAQGYLVAYNDDGTTGLDSYMPYTPTSSGTYYIAANSFDSETGSYLLEVQSDTDTDTDTDTDSVGASISTASSVSVGSSVTGRINFAQDADWYAITLAEGSQYTISLQGSETSAGTLVDPVLSLLDSSGTFIVSNDDEVPTTFNSLLNYTPSTSDVYYISTHGYADGVGTYSLSVDTPVESMTTIQMGTFMNGNLETLLDTYQVEIMAGNYYTLNVVGASSGLTLLDPYVTIESLSQSFFRFDDNSGTGLNASLSFTASESGTHIVSVGGYHANDDDNGYGLLFNSHTF